MKFTDSFRFMSTSFSSLTDNLLKIHGENVIYCRFKFNEKLREISKHILQ